MSAADAHRPLIDALLDTAEAAGAGRTDFVSEVSRAHAAALIEDALALYGCRAGSSASIYAAVRLSDRLGLGTAAAR